VERNVQDQKGMRSDADAALRDRYRVFVEIMAGPNPLTPDDVRLLIAKHPGRYNLFHAWAKELP
jgi:hypothetical protein